MSTIGLYFAGLSAEQTNALRARLNKVAGSLGYTAQGGPTAGEGNVAALLQAIDAGEVAVVRLPTVDRAGRFVNVR